MAAVLKSVDLAQPDVADGDLRGCSLEFNADESGDVVGAFEVVVDEDRHELAVDDVHHHRTAGDDLVLIPSIDVDVAAECLPRRDGADECVVGGVAGLRAGGLGDLAAPGEDAERGVLGVELAAVLLVLRVYGEPEVGLWAGHQPGRFGKFLTGTRAWLDVNPGLPYSPAVLDAGASTELDLDLELQVEVMCFRVFVIRPGAVVADVGVGRADCGRVGLADDGPVFDTPDGRVAIPSGESLAIEDLFEAGVVVEVEGVGLMESPLRGLCSWCGGLLSEGCDRDREKCEEEGCAHGEMRVTRPRRHSTISSQRSLNVSRTVTSPFREIEAANGGSSRFPMAIILGSALRRIS